MMLFTDFTNTSPTEITSAPVKANQYDVVCGRGRQAFNNDGNKRLRKIVSAHLDAYSKASSKIEKSCVVSSIIKGVRSAGDFVKKDEDTGCFEKVTERMAREKVGQALRDALHTTYKSSTMAKKRRRMAEQQHQDHAVSNIVNSNEEVIGVIQYVAKKVDSESHSETRLTAMFMAANMRILKELKDSKSAELFSEACDRFQHATTCEDASDSGC